MKISNIKRPENQVAFVRGICHQLFQRSITASGDNPITVYTCGAMDGLTVEAMTNWRKEAESQLRESLKGKLDLVTLRVLHPTRRDFSERPKDNDYSEELVELDKQDINQSDIVLVRCTDPSWGTAMEISYAAHFPTPKLVVGFLHESKPAKKDLIDAVSPWVVSHVNVLKTTREEAVEFISQVIKGEHNEWKG